MSAHKEHIGNQGLETAGQSKNCHAQFLDLTYHLIFKGRWRRGLLNINSWILIHVSKYKNISAKIENESYFMQVLKLIINLCFLKLYEETPYQLLKIQESFKKSIKRSKSITEIGFINESYFMQFLKRNWPFSKNV